MSTNSEVLWGEAMNFAKSMLFALGLPVLVIGCSPSVTVDTRFSTTAAGLVNSGFNQIGSLYYVDFEVGQIQKVEEINAAGFPMAGSPKASTVTYGNLKSFGLEANSKKLDIAKLSGQISREMSVRLEDFTKLSVTRPGDAIQMAFQNAAREEHDPWRLTEASANTRGYHMFVQGEVRAQKADIYFGEEKGSKDGLSLEIAGVGSIDLKYSKSSNTSWVGTGTPVLIEVYWFKVYKDAVGNMKYRTALPNPGDLSRVSDILRKAG